MTKSDTPETHFFGLFDGHAGGKCSHHVANNLANTLVEDDFFSTNLPQAIKRAYYTCNEQFLKIAEKAKLHDGSTGICSIIRDNKLVVANAGDCRALLMSNGRPIQLSTDHKPTNPEEQKRIAALGGTIVYCMGVARVNRVLAVARAFGNRTLKSVIRPDAEITQRDLVDGDDFLVMASDGLWDVLKNKDVCDVCYSPFLQRKPQLIADELVNLALARGSMDNVTCIVVNLADFRTANSGGTKGPSSRENNDVLNKSMMMETTNNYENFNQHANRSIIAGSDFDDEHEPFDLNVLHSAVGAKDTNNNNQNGGFKKFSKTPSNNNMGHDGIPKQYSLGSLLLSQADSSNDTDNNNSNVASMIMNKKNNPSQGRIPLVKSGSTNTMPLMDSTLVPSFPMVGNMFHPNNNNATENLNGRLFHQNEGAAGPSRQASTKLPVRQGSTVASDVQAFKNSLPSNVRGSMGTMKSGSTMKGNNNSGDHAAPLSRASLNDLSNILNEFNGNGSY